LRLCSHGFFCLFVLLLLVNRVDAQVIWPTGTRTVTVGQRKNFQRSDEDRSTKKEFSTFWRGPRKNFQRSDEDRGRIFNVLTRQQPTTFWRDNGQR
jgi:hypothetical protein